MKKKEFKQKVSTINALINGKECDFYAKEISTDKGLIDYIISSLDEDSQRILYFDFVYKNNKYWWREYYSKSTYYRLKNIAMDAFLKQSSSFN